MKLLVRLPILLLALCALCAGVLAGLARLGVVVPRIAAEQAGNHGALMIGALLGTVISLERAVALPGRWPYLAPLAAALGGPALLLGLPPTFAQSLFIVAALVLTVATGLMLLRHRVAYMATLALGALSWLVGNIVWPLTGSIASAVPWWMAFLVLTIAGERLELARFLPTPAIARRLFALIVALMLVGLAGSGALAGLGLRSFAAGLLALSLWLLRYDLARRTVRQAGLTRYIAVCLLAGYAWLAFGGVLGLLGGFGSGSSLRDAALHAVFLGFVFSMIFGHAPIIVPAIAGIRLPYHPAFYLQLALLHGSLLARVVGDLGQLPALREDAAIANAVALLVFVATMGISILRGLKASGRSGPLDTDRSSATRTLLGGGPS